MAACGRRVPVMTGKCVKCGAATESGCDTGKVGAIVTNCAISITNETVGTFVYRKTGENPMTNDELKNLPKQAKLDILTEATLDLLLEQFREGAAEPPKKQAKVIQFPGRRYVTVYKP
jgi:hypothetical protein